MSPSLDRLHASMPTATRLGFVPWAALLLLVITSARLIALNIDQYHRFQRAEERKAYVPSIGSLAGIAANGEPVTLDLGDSESALVFVLRATHLAADLQFWNDVLSHGSLTTHAWGICDSGAACDGVQSSARFRVVGFLDPFGMRSVVNADDKGEALVYGGRSVLKARIPRDASASAIADAIRRSLS